MDKKFPPQYSLNMKTECNLNNETKVMIGGSQPAEKKNNQQTNLFINKIFEKKIDQKSI